MRKITACVLTVMFLLVAGTLAAADFLQVDDGAGTERWAFTTGPEFKGAKGSFDQGKTEDNKPCSVIKYDFSEGGRYVGAAWSGQKPDKLDAVSVTVAGDSEINLIFRLVDAKNRIFQAVAKTVKPGTNTFTYDVEKGWQGIWGGTGEHKIPAQPISSVFVGVSVKDGQEKSGMLQILSLKVKPAADVEVKDLYKVGESAYGMVPGWKLSGKWSVSWGNPVYTLSAEPAENAGGAVATFTMPDGVRDAVKEYTLSAGKVNLINYSPKFPLGLNPHQQYKIDVTVKSGESSWSTKAIISGVDADKDFFGPLKSSADIETSKFGVCTHFIHKGVWTDYRTIMDKISEGGIKWIRDGINLEQDTPEGVYKVRDYDFGWLRYAVSKKLKPIVIIRMYAKETPEQFAAKALAIAEQTQGLVSVYELGNEPNNFGGWIKKYGGNWNGKDKNNTTSPWVKEHVKNTNAGAEAIKAKFPSAIVIGTGGPTPVNFRELEVGLSKALDGVVDHPYAYSLPAELVPFNTKSKDRDGIVVSDDRGTYIGMVKAYYKKFKDTGHPRSLWATEFGWSNFVFDGENEKGIYAAYTEEAQAAYLSRRMLLTLTTPIPAFTMYDFKDDFHSKENFSEGNFGIIRDDHREKIAYFAIQRLCSFFAGFKFNPSIKAEVAAAPLHRAAQGGIKLEWDGAVLMSGDGVEVHGFTSTEQPGVVQFAVWSEQVYGREFSKRSVKLRIKNAVEYADTPVAVDLLTGKSYDLKCEVEGSDLILPRVMLGGAPVILRIYKEL